MSATPVPCAWWHNAPPPRIEPLAVVRTVLDCVQRGEAVPEPAATVLAKALSDYLEGKSYDISANLGLRTRQGGRYETPLVLEKRRHRDELIAKIYAMQTGSKQHRAERVASLLKSPSSVLSRGELATHVAELHEKYEGNLPTSARQIDRVVTANKV